MHRTNIDTVHCIVLGFFIFNIITHIIIKTSCSAIQDVLVVYIKQFNLFWTLWCVPDPWCAWLPTTVLRYVFVFARIHFNGDLLHTLYYSISYICCDNSNILRIWIMWLQHTYNIYLVSLFVFWYLCLFMMTLWYFHRTRPYWNLIIVTLDTHFLLSW